MIKKLAFVLTLSTVGLLAACGDDTDTTTSTSTTTTTSSSSGTSTSGSSSSGGGGAGGGMTGDCSQDMYTKYTQAGFEAVNNAIIANAVMLTNMNPSPIGDSLKPVIADQAKAAVLTKNLLDFLVQAYGGPKNYAGKDMVTAHTGLAITSEQYDAFVTQAIVPALTDSGVAPDDITKCFAPVVTDAAFKATIVGL